MLCMAEAKPDKVGNDREMSMKTPSPPAAKYDYGLHDLAATEESLGVMQPVRGC